jgi:hypothetical protein
MSTSKYTPAPQRDSLDETSGYTQAPPSYQAEAASSGSQAPLLGSHLDAPRSSEDNVPDDFKVSILRYCSHPESLIRSSYRSTQHEILDSIGIEFLQLQSVAVCLLPRLPVAK